MPRRPRVLESATRSCFSAQLRAGPFAFLECTNERACYRTRPVECARLGAPPGLAPMGVGDGAPRKARTCRLVRWLAGRIRPHVRRAGGGRHIHPPEREAPPQFLPCALAP